MHPLSFRTAIAVLASAAWPACAQDAGAGAPARAVDSLARAFEAAWARQPESLSVAALRDAAAARRDAASSWTAEPVALEVSGRTDRFNAGDGAREYVAGLAAPMWHWGERDRTRSLADAEARSVSSRAEAARLRTAGQVREAWWAWQRALIEESLARDRHLSARRLADDVARRVNAGELARSDGHQAETAVAAAEVSWAEARMQQVLARQILRGLVGPGLVLAASDLPVDPEPLPTPLRDTSSHPVLAELVDRESVASKAAELADVQSRGNPELTISTTRERAAMGEPFQPSITVGLRIPLGSDARHRTRIATAAAEAAEVRARLAIERDQLVEALDAARARVEASRQRFEASARREKLAGETRAFFEKSFRLGESDLPTRLRVELEAVEATRQASLARVDFAASVSALRQAAGLLPQ